METAPEQLGRYIRRRRKALRLSQQAVAHITGKNQSQIARLESGSGNPSYEVASQVLRGLGVDLVAVPIRLLPAVRHLIDATEGISVPKRTRLVGNNPDIPPEDSR